jgi:hypothetical protein
MYVNEKQILGRPIKTVVILAIIGFSLFLIVTLFIVNAMRYKNISIEPTQNTKITILEISGDNKTQTKTLAETTTNISISLKKGIYTVKYSGEDMEKQISSIDVKDDMVVKTPELNFSITKLQNLLNQEKSNNMLPKIPVQYDLFKEKLYKKGDWYSAIYIPKNWYDPSTPVGVEPRMTNDSNQLDIIKIVAKKENGQWQVMAGPDIVINKEDKKEIPSDILKDINNTFID